jgi:hypothetical protein
VANPRKRDLLPLVPTELDLEGFDWPLEKKAYGLLWLLLPLCPFWWAIDKREPDYSSPSPQQEDDWNRRRANWVLGWLVVLIVIWRISPDSEPWKLIVGIVAAFRLLEVFVTGLGTILDQRQQIRARNAVTILIYAVQVAFIFAILYHSFAATGFGEGAEGHPTTPPDFLYLSWSAVVSLGHETFPAKSSAARFLEVATTTSSIFLLTVLFGYAVDAVSKGGEGEKSGPREPGGKSEPEGIRSPARTPCHADPVKDEPDSSSLLALCVERVAGSKRLRVRLKR